jgi:hypothetical protein
MKPLVLLALLALAGCGDPKSPVSGTARVQSSAQECCTTTAQDRPPYAALLEAHRDAGEKALRVTFDAVRSRLWVLDLEHVHVYDIAKRVRIGRMPLPNWSVAELICPPDMALDRSGNVLVSDNTQPTLWRIDADTFRFTGHPLRLVGSENVDIGFGALAFATDGSLYGIAATGGTLWRIDVESASAQRVELDALLPEGCSLTVR